jgi:hypothetical protein
MLEMDTQQPQPSDPALRALYDRLAQMLRATLPPPIGDPAGETGSSSRQALARRDAAAFAVITSLAPADATEGALAAHYVIASAHAAHSLWQAGQHPPASEPAMKLRKQYARFTREALRSRSRLLRLQEARDKREAANADARPKSPQDGEGHGTGGGLPTSDEVMAQPAQPPPSETKPTPPRRSPPTLRLIQGGLAN